MVRRADVSPFLIGVSDFRRLKRFDSARRRLRVDFRAPGNSKDDVGVVCVIVIVSVAAAVVAATPAAALMRSDKSVAGIAHWLG